ncbi:E3 ubiquitin-protein ligase MARCHF2-like [Daktulosphaira vitifoliae]|uniref:E3 ubiquitin-protein ligase MARCHF2-like n=1 Tax=Daktulosphaira vitifoliae TaxID=58002 RepID=UPI0021AA1978|nr:E3 ubiquitin-protein ligase MARCHF2-like [Daktulosphaira vitifoliae]
MATPGFCRICLQPDIEKSNKCISPCFCCGTMSKVHKTCLEKWLGQSGYNSCEICEYQYKTHRISTYTYLKSFKEWLQSTESENEMRQSLPDLFLFIVYTPLLSLVSYLGLETNEAIFRETANTTVNKIM